MKKEEPIRKNTSMCLVSSDYLRVISIAGYRSNLALTTIVHVNTSNNETEISYKVNPLNDKLKRISKTFVNYDEAYNYYIKVYNKFAN